MKTIFKIFALLFFAAAAGSIQSAAVAKDKGDLLVRARGIVVIPDESSTITPIGGAATVSNAVMPELDFTYFFSENVAAELILATTKHDIGATGTTLGTLDLGHVWLLPPTLTLQYHFAPKKKVSPYIGAGVNVTFFYNDNPGPTVVHIDYKNGFGFAVQGGVDFQVGERTYFNIDVKKIWLDTKATIDAGGLGIVNANVDINPWIVGAGFGWTF